MVKKAFQKFLHHIGRYNKLIEDYMRAAQYSHDPAIAYVNWGIDLAQEGKMSEALEKFEKAATISPNRTEPFNNWGVALAKEGRMDEAIEKFRHAMTLDPKSMNSLILWGAALLEKGDMDGAREKYEQAVQINPSNPEPYVNWGIALARMNKHEEAIRHFQAALAIYSYQPHVYFLWGAVLAEMEKYEEAIEKFRITLRHMPKHSEAYHFWAIALNRLGHFEESAEKSRQALELDPDNPEIYLNMGDAMANLGRYPLAVENYRQASILDPKLADTYMSWGSVLCRMGNNEEGYKKFTMALELDPNLTQVHYLWGVSLNENRRFHEAIEHLEKVYEEQPQYMDNLINYGLAQIHTGNLSEGYQLFKEAEKLDPWNPKVHFIIGTQQLSQGNTQLALKHLNKALEMEKDFADAAINLSLALCETGDIEEAIRTLRPFMRQNQDSPEVNFFYGMMLYRNADLKEAAVKFKKAIQLRPAYMEAILGMAEISIKLGELDNAEKYVEELFSHQAEFVPALFLKGVICVKRGELAGDDFDLFKQAKELYARAFSYDPHHLEAHVNYAYLTGKMNKPDEMNKKFAELLENPSFERSTIVHYWTKALEEMGYKEEAARLIKNLQ